ncbi:MAG: helix-turn-helix transcriptional regulator [Phenylobacterium sp.]|nr:helix-turn-helix transcriptional regulator [Phenylobacterium sp.]
MSPASFRKFRGRSQAQFAIELGLSERSKGYISRLEAGATPWPLHLALRLEKISDGMVPAASICAQAAELVSEARP